jgi:hypothetical protein
MGKEMNKEWTERDLNATAKKTIPSSRLVQLAIISLISDKINKR